MATWASGLVDRLVVECCLLRPSLDLERGRWCESIGLDTVARGDAAIGILSASKGYSDGISRVFNKKGSPIDETPELQQGMVSKC